VKSQEWGPEEEELDSKRIKGGQKCEEKAK